MEEQLICPPSAPKLICWHSIPRFLPVCGVFGRMQFQAFSLCSATAACRWPGPEPGMLCGVIPGQKRAPGCQRAKETGRVCVLLSLGTTHKGIADLVSVRPRSLCSSPTGCAEHQSCEKVIQTGDSSAFRRNLELWGPSVLFEGRFQPAAWSVWGRRCFDEPEPAGVPTLLCGELEHCMEVL